MAHKKASTTLVKVASKPVEFYSKEHVVLAIRWLFGLTRKEALDIYKATSYKYHNEVGLAFKMNARMAFYAD